VASLGTQSVEECYIPDWLGVPMYCSLFESATNQPLIEEAGLQIRSACEETGEEDGVPVTFLWLVAQKPAELPLQKSNTALGCRHRGPPLLLLFRCCEDLVDG
jgi:hypothetical protein